MSSQLLILTTNKTPGTHTIEIIPGHIVPKSVLTSTAQQVPAATLVPAPSSQKSHKKEPDKSSRKRKSKHVLREDEVTKVVAPRKKMKTIPQPKEVQVEPKIPKEHPKKAGIRCSYSQCSCTDRKCVVYRTVKKPVIEVWKEFINEHDAKPRLHKGIRLCQCHFRNLNSDTPPGQKLRIFMKPEVLTSSESSYHKNIQNKLMKANERLNLIEESLLKMFNEDQIKKLVDEKPFVHYSDRTIEESLQLYKACGVRGYLMLLKRGYPLPTIRTLQRMNKKKICADTSEDIEEQILTVEAIIDENN